MKIFVTNDFKRGLVKLQKDNEKEAIKDLKNAINRLDTSPDTKIKFNNNHRLKNSPFNEMHIGGHNSDILFVWKYDYDTKAYIFILKGRDLTNHKRMSKKNYNKEVDYEEFDLEKLKVDSFNKKEYQTMKEFEIRFSLSGDVSIVVEGKNFDDAIKKIKKMTDEELLDEIVDNGSVRELVADDFDLEDTLSDSSSFKVKVYNIRDIDGRKVSKTITMEVKADNYHGEVTDDDIRDGITDKLITDYDIDSDDFDFDVLEEL